VRVVLADGGPVVDADGREHHRPDVVCPLRPDEGRTLARQLLDLAELAEPRTVA
jgi:hypothetical protein